MNLKNTLCTNVSGGENSCKTCGLGASENTSSRGNYVCYLVIAVIFVGLTGAKNEGV